ncbi:MAG: hypothetical protein NTZ48_07140, partial [Candidatus Omnitrophica bacterium]|nr:hypothetical protein [Candidatus Omnitrophota bacterium]
IRDSKGPDFRIQGKNLSSFCNGEYQNTDSEILRLIREGTNSELEEKILAVVNNDYAKLVEARFVVSFYLFTSEPEHRDVLENEMLASVVTFGLVDDMIRNALITGNTQDRLTALEGVFNNLQLQHLVVDRAQLDLNQIPEQLKNDLRNMQRRFLEQAEEGKQTEQGLLSFIPMTLIEAVFRGYIGMDCSKDYYNGYPYVWTVHPNNKYYRIRKNGEDLGYIGLSEGKVEGTDGGRVLAIDTIQMHTQDRELIDNIIRQLEQVALQNGFWGIVIPKDLSMSFNSEITQGAIKDNVYFKSVVNVKVTYLDEGKTQTLIKYRGKDEYHSMMYGDFVYLPLHKENKVFMSDGIRGEVTEFIDRLSMEQEVGGFKEIWEYNE